MPFVAGNILVGFFRGTDINKKIRRCKTDIFLALQDLKGE